MSTENRMKLIAPYQLGGINLLPGSVLISTDALDYLEATGSAVPVKAEEKEKVVQQREPKYTTRDPKVK